MKSLPILFALFLLFGCNNASKNKAEDEQGKVDWNKDELEVNFDNDLRDFVACLNNEEYDCVVDYMPEKVFNMIPREQVIAEMENINEMGMRMHFDAFKINKISDVVLHENFYYCKISISTRTTLTLSGIMEMQKDVLAEAFEAQGMEVSETETGEIVYDGDEFVYAIAEEKNKRWKYIRIDESLKQRINAFIPVQVQIALD